MATWDDLQIGSFPPNLTSPSRVKTNIRYKRRRKEEKETRNHGKKTRNAKEMETKSVRRKVEQRRGVYAARKTVDLCLYMIAPKTASNDSKGGNWEASHFVL